MSMIEGGMTTHTAARPMTASVTAAISRPVSISSRRRRAASMRRRASAALAGSAAALPWRVVRYVVGVPWCQDGLLGEPCVRGRRTAPVQSAVRRPHRAPSRA